jgi:hypothetical protein
MVAVTGGIDWSTNCVRVKVDKIASKDKEFRHTGAEIEGATNQISTTTN